MGLNISGTIDRARHPEQYPDKAKGPTFDPMYGFPDGRKPKTFSNELRSTINNKTNIKSTSLKRSISSYETNNQNQLVKYRKKNLSIKQEIKDC
ncbi:unnamed protein product [Rotaria sp. Silwood1]|nr:unnamed protein product [Rotaria sp. Silwood1]